MACLEVHPELSLTPSSGAKFRGYEAFHPSIVHASVALMEKCGIVQTFLDNICLTREELLAVPQARYMEASLDCLEALGYLERPDEKYRPTVRGRQLFQQAPVSIAMVEIYDALMQGVKQILLSDANQKPSTSLQLDTLLLSRPYYNHEIFAGTQIVPAVTLLHESSFSSGPDKGQTAAAVLLQGKSIRVTDFSRHGTSVHIPIAFVEVLLRTGLLTGKFPDFSASEHGKKVLELGGYSELILSYFQMMAKMFPLLRGDLQYGMEGNVQRDPELNARASNAILHKKVAPYIVTQVKEHVQGVGAHVDFGSGGGDMLMQLAEAQAAVSMIGIDINPETVRTATGLIQSKGMEDRISFVVGSITDRNVLEQAAKQIPAMQLKGVTTSINFILHDIGPQLSREFLHNYAEVFGAAPLIITETMKIPIPVLRQNPGYQPVTFQFMHTASGQHLYYESEFRELLQSCGFGISKSREHSSVAGTQAGERLSTIVTWVAQYQGKTAQ